MKRFATVALASSLIFSLGAFGAKDKKKEKEDEGFKFTDVKVVKCTPVKDQNKSGTCWSFSTTSFLESEVMRNGGPELDLSDMYAVRMCYGDKADKYMRTDGHINFAQGGSAEDVIYVLRTYGAIPESAYDGLKYGEKKHSHYEMEAGLKGFLQGVMKGRGRSNLTTAWKPAFNGILDAYLGEVPETFVYEGKTYTPKTFAAEVVKLNPDDYISITSYTHHPFYEEFALEVADNWIGGKSQNVPIEELEKIVDNAINNNYTVAWGADVSEGGFKWKEGFAVLPAAIEEGDLSGTELSRWVKLSDSDRTKKQFDVKGPGFKEKKVTQESRQQGFDNKTTTDDHGMEIIGIAKDQAGNKFYKVKNSWDTNQVYGGYFYVSVPYFLEKTMSLMVNKNAVPADIAAKFKK